MPMMRKYCLGVSMGVLAFGVAASPVARAQDFPIKPIRFLTSSEPGGGGDIVLRIVRQDLTSALGQPVVVDNRPLAISGEIVAKAPPDGYTAAAYGTTLWLGPLLQPLPYNPLKDFAPITMMTRQPGVIMVHPSVPVSSIKELIALAKAKPGVLNYGSGNSGGIAHLGFELFKSMAGVDIVRIPYKGAGPAGNALVAGEVQVLLATATAATPHMKSGRAKALAVTTAQRSALIPGLPTVAESGVPGYEAASVYGMVTTAGTPAAVVNRLNRELVRILVRSDVKEKFLLSGTEVVASTPAEFAAFLKSEIARMGKVIKDAGIRAD